MTRLRAGWKRTPSRSHNTGTVCTLVLPGVPVDSQNEALGIFSMPPHIASGLTQHPADDTDGMTLEILDAAPRLDTEAGALMDALKTASIYGA